ncbi:MAG: hypothetical protein BGO51_08105 [Rhodospirillales bacterium 69-11]|jgi:hypothetical protein|nr:hypothetical protein [Rhodospirillales bacterium]MBN8926687.1 hypothetical protein [Rhodospirillales bacterium]OJW20402.1 MAG: hypothetical protein BGO51_08105 [Rhodospirillales bacterium 69-11]
MFSILIPLAVLIFMCIERLLGLTPEQRAEAKAKRAEREAKKLARQLRFEAERQRREWRALVERQMADGSARFADERESLDALGGRGGRRSNLDDRWF